MNDRTETRRNTAWLWIAFGVMFLLHQDIWFWEDRTLVFGFLPIGLFYHAIYSLGAGLLWAAAVKFAWPSHVEEDVAETLSDAPAAPEGEHAG